jgi:hypothetical protein
MHGVRSVPDELARTTARIVDVRHGDMIICESISCSIICVFRKFYPPLRLATMDKMISCVRNLRLWVLLCEAIIRQATSQPQLERTSNLLANFANRNGTRACPTLIIVFLRIRTAVLSRLYFRDNVRECYGIPTSIVGYDCFRVCYLLGSHPRQQSESIE